MKSPFRRELINSLAGFKSANLLGTSNKQGNTNLAVFNSVVHIGANPPLLGFILRPLTVPRHSWQNIQDTGFYTLNHINHNFIGQAHQTSAKYPEEVSEFKACKLTPQYSQAHQAPYVQEALIKTGLKFSESHEIKANGTLLVVGEVVEIILEADVQEPDGLLDLEKAGTVAISGLNSYFTASKLATYPYARPQKP